MAGPARTLFDKVWDDHVVAQEPGSPAVLYIDLHLVHEVTSPQAFAGLAARGLKVRRPDRTVATMDHSIPTIPGGLSVVDDQAKAQLRQLGLAHDERRSVATTDVEFYRWTQWIFLKIYDSWYDGERARPVRT